MKTIGPFSVMAMVCSEWAPREPSRHAGSSRPSDPEDFVGGLEEPRFDGDDQAFRQLVAVVGAAVVRHVRVAVDDVANAVTAELEVDRVAVFARDVADGVGDVAETVAGLATSMAAASASSVHLMMRRSSGSGSLPTTKLTAESATQPSTEMARSRETRSPLFRL